MKVLVTGATGFVGYHVARLLNENGSHVVALVRNSGLTEEIEALGVQLVRGDIRDFDSVSDAMRGCRRVYHVAADYRLWVPDPRTMYDINVGGTKNVFRAALEQSTEKVVYTSTAGTLATGSIERPSSEDLPVDINEMVGHYKRSKFQAERAAEDYIEKGVPGVIVNPTTPVGAMDVRPTPSGKTIVDFVNGKIPAYIDTGLNYADVEDVALGHLLAADKGKVGEKYLLGNRNMSLKEFFTALADITGQRPPRFRLPYRPVLLAAYISEAVSSWITHKHPAIPVTGVKMAKTHMYFDCSKAVRELGVPQNPVERALEKAVKWYADRGYIEKNSLSAA